jgi:Domain of unknown function (DUF397)
MTVSLTQQITAVQWRKSSHSGSGNNCVEVAEVAGARAVRDSKNPDGGHLIFGPDAWQAFITDVKRRRYDDL